MLGRLGSDRRTARRPPLRITRNRRKSGDHQPCLPPSNASCSSASQRGRKETDFPPGLHGRGNGRGSHGCRRILALQPERGRGYASPWRHVPAGAPRRKLRRFDGPGQVPGHQRDPVGPYLPKLSHRDHVRQHVHPGLQGRCALERRALEERPLQRAAAPREGRSGRDATRRDIPRDVPDRARCTGTGPLSRSTSGWAFTRAGGQCVDQLASSRRSRRPFLQPSPTCRRSRASAPVLWFDDQALPAAEIYCSLLPESRIDRIRYTPEVEGMGEPGGGGRACGKATRASRAAGVESRPDRCTNPRHEGARARPEAREDTSDDRAPPSPLASGRLRPILPAPDRIADPPEELHRGLHLERVRNPNHHARRSRGDHRRRRPSPVSAPAPGIRGDLPDRRHRLVVAGPGPGPEPARVA